MFGFLLQWPTLLTLVMFPILVIMYIRLAKSEEREALAEFGDAYRRYAAEVPAFIPRISRFKSEEHTSELQSLMRISYAVFCLKKNNILRHNITEQNNNH